MDIATLLQQLADTHIHFDEDRPTEYHHAGHLTVVSSEVVFSSPDPQEFSICEGVPQGSHPVHLGVVRRRNEDDGEETSYVSLALIPFAAPAAIAEATFEDVIEDWQPLGPDYGFLRDVTAMDPFGDDGFADVDALIEHVESELATPDSRAWVDVVVDRATGANLLAFRVGDESALCLEARDADGTLLALLFTGTL